MAAFMDIILMKEKNNNVPTHSESKLKHTLRQSVCYYLLGPLGKEIGSKSKKLL